MHRHLRVIEDNNKIAEDPKPRVCIWFIIQYGKILLHDGQS